MSAQISFPKNYDRTLLARSGSSNNPGTWVAEHDGGRDLSPWRVRQWAAEQWFESVFLLDGVGHSLEPWLSAASWTNDK